MATETETTVIGSNDQSTVDTTLATEPQVVEIVATVPPPNIVERSESTTEQSSTASAAAAPVAMEISEATAPVVQPTAPVVQPTAPVVQPTAPVVQPTAPTKSSVNMSDDDIRPLGMPIVEYNASGGSNAAGSGSGSSSSSATSTDQGSTQGASGRGSLKRKACDTDGQTSGRQIKPSTVKYEPKQIIERPLKLDEIVKSIDKLSCAPWCKTQGLYTYLNLNYNSSPFQFMINVTPSFSPVTVRPSELANTSETAAASLSRPVSAQEVTDIFDPISKHVKSMKKPASFIVADDYKFKDMAQIGKYKNNDYNQKAFQKQVSMGKASIPADAERHGYSLYLSVPVKSRDKESKDVIEFSCPFVDLNNKHVIDPSLTLEKKRQRMRELFPVDPRTEKREKPNLLAQCRWNLMMNDKEKTVSHQIRVERLILLPPRVKRVIQADLAQLAQEMGGQTNDDQDDQHDNAQDGENVYDVDQLSM